MSLDTRYLTNGKKTLYIAIDLIAAIWNLYGLAWTEEKHPELMDIPSRMEKENERV